MVLPSMSRSVIKIFFVLLIAATAACGKARQISTTRDVSAPNLTYALSMSGINGDTMVLVAGPADLSAASLCVSGQDGRCVTNRTDMSFVRDFSGRRIFQSRARVVLVTGAIVTFFTTSSSGQTAEARISLATRGAGSGIGSGGVRWKVVLMASDQGNSNAWIKAFDNARRSLKQLLATKGVAPSDIREMSLHPDQQSTSVLATSAQGLRQALTSLAPFGPNDACLVHMTSHGSPDGFNIGNERLAPSELNSMLDSSCGQRPTVLLISACYSGLYTLDSSGVKRPNRIILTASSSDQTSFGCGAENEYTFWDGCLIETMPNARSWRDFATAVEACIVRKEGGQTQSKPQTFIGAQLESLAMPGNGGSVPNLGQNIGIGGLGNQVGVAGSDPMVPNPSNVQLSQSEFDNIKFTNQARQGRGLSILKVLDTIMQTSRDQSRIMMQKGVMEHGFTSGWNAENIARGQQSGQEVVNVWINSPGHAANMFNTAYSWIGVGDSMGQGSGSPYWTQQFK